MKSTDNTERATANVTGSASLVVSNDSLAPSPNGKITTFPGHNATFYRPGSAVNAPVNEIQQTSFTNSLEPQATNLLNYNMAIKSLPIRPRPMGPTNMNHQNFPMHQPWQALQYGAPNNTQVPFNIQCKPINGFISQNFFQKVNHDGMQGTQTILPNNFQDQINNPPVVPQQLSESVLPLENMQTPSKKEVLKKTLLEKSKENAKNATRTSCLSPVSDCEVESSNNSDFVSKKSTKGRKASNATNHPQQETQMSQSGIYEKLASLGSEPNRKYFLSQLFSFMNANSTPIKVMPVVCRQTVDLYKMYNIVREFGGLEKVCKMKQWRDVSSALGFGGSTSAGFALKKNYCKYLFAYECKFDRDDIDPNPILVSLDLVSKLETKKKPQESSQSSDTMIKDDSASQDSFSELSNGIEEYTTPWEKPTDLPVFLNINVLSSSDASTEYTKVTRFKRRKLMHHDCGNASIQKLTRSLSSGMLCEMSWALDCLSITTYDPSSPPVNLSKHPKLLITLLELMASSMDKLIMSSDEYQPDVVEKLKSQMPVNLLDEVNEEHFVPPGHHIKNSKGKGFYSKLCQAYRSNLIKKYTESKSTHVQINQYLDIPQDLPDVPRRVIDFITDQEIKREISEPSEDLLNVSSDFASDLGKKCVVISNILRNLASVPWNEKEMAANQSLLAFLSFYLHFNHKHSIKTSVSIPEVSMDANEEMKEFCLPIPSLGDSFWWWSTMINIRSNCIVILSYIASHIDLASLDGDICYKLCHGLLHWGVCQSSEAHDLHSGLNISIQRIALEALSKLCISKSNVDFIVATPPFYSVVNFVTLAVKHLYKNDSDIVRDIILGILSRMVEAEGNIARALVVDGSTPFVLLGLIDEYIDPSIIESAAPNEVFTYDGNSAKSGSYTACKAAEIFCQLSRVPENIQYLTRFKKHLLEIVTASIDDDVLTTLVSEILAAVC